MEENGTILEFNKVIDYLLYFKNIDENGDAIKEVIFAPVGVTSINKRLYAFNDKDLPNPRKHVKIFAAPDGTIISISFYRQKMHDFVTKYSFEAGRAFDYLHGFEVQLYRELKRQNNKPNITELKTSNNYSYENTQNESAVVTGIRR